MEYLVLRFHISIFTDLAGSTHEVCNEFKEKMNDKPTMKDMIAISFDSPARPSGLRTGALRNKALRCA